MLLTIESKLRMNVDRYSFAEAFQMYCEACREDWSRTASIVAHLVAVNSAKKNTSVEVSKYNPWEETRGSSVEGVPLAENIGLLAQLAGKSR